jgi:hypothetical protein
MKKFFEAVQFTATEFHSAADKAKFANALAEFALKGFPRERFTKPLYQQLSNCFGHIAHFDIGGFYATWFADPKSQAEWVRHVVGYIPCGDPAWTYSDMERLFKGWLAAHTEEVNAAIRKNSVSKADALDAEAERRVALDGKRTQRFQVVAKSSNTGAFGHHQFVMLAEDGCTYKVHHIQCNGIWSVGQRFDVQLDHNRLPTWEGMSVECPERIANVAPDIVEKYWHTPAA